MTVKVQGGYHSPRSLLAFLRMANCSALFTSDPSLRYQKNSRPAGPRMEMGAVVEEESQTKSESVLPNWSVRTLLAVLTEIAGCWPMKGRGFGMARITHQERWL